MKYSGSVLTSRLDRVLAQAASNVKNTRPLMVSLSEDMLDAVEENFEKQGRQPKWKSLSSVTRKRRRAIGKGSTKILQQSGLLAASKSRNAKTSNSEAVVGTNVKYAPTHQFGARKGQYGKTKRGAPIPWGKIPARPFFKFIPKDINQFVETTRKYMLKDV